MKGLLLLNLGTPDAPETPAVRRYLREFLMDGRVLDINPVGRWLLVNGIIAPFRSPKSAAAYKTVWMPEGSPLLVYGEALKEGVQAALGQGWKVALGMRYGRPGTLAALQELAGCEEIVVLPLYPQFASSSSSSSLEHVMKLAAEMPVPPPLRVVQDFYAQPFFIQAQAELAREAVQGADHVLFSYHGVPERQVQYTDPTGSHCKFNGCCDAIGPNNRHCYRAQCFATTRALIAALDLDPERCSTSFQSRLGRIPWIRPYTDEVLVELGQQGIGTLAVLTPSFVSDCLETIEEIGDRGVEEFTGAGGTELRRVPCVNATEPFVQGLSEFVRGL
ncbi:MAG: ferrochelatase [Myxococcota bacterium]|nr:ferrochelatase [Myxococcota bacterium]